MLPLIGITTAEMPNTEEPWAPGSYGQKHTYIDAVVHAGGAPVLLPLTRNLGVLRSVYDRLDGLLLSGGNDVSPELYGAQKHSATTGVSELRDTVELQLVQWALVDAKPVLAICRGMQLMNVACGGSLYQDLPSERPGCVDHEAALHAQDYTHIAHELTLQPDSKLAAILGTDAIAANARHHQAVKIVANEFTPVAWAEDGVIEAIEYTGSGFAIGVQPHPESLEASAVPAWRKLFRGFIEASYDRDTYHRRQHVVPTSIKS